MTIGTLNLFGIPVNKITLPDWDNLKPQLLEMINLDGDEYRSLTCTTDFFHVGASDGQGHPYLEKFWELVGPSIEECWQMMNLPPHKDSSEIQLWSQRYYRGDYHDLHNHGFGNMSGVLFLEFDPELHSSTRLQCPHLDPLYGRITMMKLPDVREGEIILFPAGIGHESMPNQSDIPRTVMSLNIPIQ
tara:strand:+ start:3382 stop:3945 length:564 start_codon:yes stop_codon:yes gene_type:complete